MSSTRTIMIGKKTVVITNVPDDVSDEELETTAKTFLYQKGVIGMGAS